MLLRRIYFRTVILQAAIDIPPGFAIPESQHIKFMIGIGKPLLCALQPFGIGYHNALHMLR